jgi:hypothetical protein
METALSILNTLDDRYMHARTYRKAVEADKAFIAALRACDEATKRVWLQDQLVKL